MAKRKRKRNRHSPSSSPSLEARFNQRRHQWLHLVASLSDTFIDPSDDWPNATILLDSPSLRTPLVSAVDFSPAEKHHYANVIFPSLIRSVDADIVGLALSTWASASDAYRPSEDPDRIEIVIVSIFTYGREATYAARILRGDQHLPTLTPWREEDPGSGLFIDAVRSVLRAGLN